MNNNNQEIQEEEANEESSLLQRDIIEDRSESSTLSNKKLELQQKVDELFS